MRRALCALILFIAAIPSALAAWPLTTTIKGIHPDFLDATTLGNVGTGWVAVHLRWSDMVGNNSVSLHASFVDNNCPDSNLVARESTTGQKECFIVSSPTMTLGTVTAQINALHARGIRVIGVIDGVPDFARINDALCGQDTTDVVNSGERIFCAPSTVASPTGNSMPGATQPGKYWFRTFTNIVAKEFAGKVQAWVILNEVNHANWFRHGCPAMQCTNKEQWIAHYSEVFNEAYDGIEDAMVFLDWDEWPAVLVSLTGQFDDAWDTALSEFATTLPSPPPVGKERSVSIKTFLMGKPTHPGFSHWVKVGRDRKWGIAQHLYPRDQRVPYFTANDLTDPERNRDGNTVREEGYAVWFSGATPSSYLKGTLTQGSVGALIGYLHQQPTLADVKVYMTEAGISSTTPSYSYPYTQGVPAESLQNYRTCDAFKNYIGTPGIRAAAIQRGLDNSQEAGALFGLWSTTTTPKEAWIGYVYSNRYEQPVDPTCGFNEIPYVRVERGWSANGHRISSRVHPETPAFNFDVAWFLLRDERPSTIVIYECWVPTTEPPTHGSGRTFATKDPHCGGRPNAINLGPMGYAYTEVAGAPEPNGWTLLRNCKHSNGQDELTSRFSNCEGWNEAEVLGWAKESVTTSRSKYTRLWRIRKAGLHWITTVLPPPGFTDERSWKILRAPEENTYLYYECGMGDRSYPNPIENCGGGYTSYGPLGYLYANQSQANDRIKLYQCHYNGDWIVTDDPQCEGWLSLGGGKAEMGYAEAWP